MDHELHVRFEGVTLARANQAAVELSDRLRDLVGPTGSLAIRKERSDTQDMGSVLVLVLGTPAVAAAATGIRDFIAKSRDSVIIETSDGKVLARGSAASNIDIAKTVAALASRKAP
jgi:hypothetical protein